MINKSKQIGRPVVILLMVFLSTQLCQAEIPSVINFQGYLADSNGSAISQGTYNITFHLWDGDNDTTANKLWEETQSVQIENGIYSVSLGSISPFSNPDGDSNTQDALTFAIPYYLGLDINGDVFNFNNALLPLNTAAYAFRAKTASGKRFTRVDDDYTLTDKDDVLVVTGDIKVTLMSATGIPGRMITIRKYDTGDTEVSLVTTSSETINGVNRDIDNGGTALILDDLNIEVTLISDGSNWIHIASFWIADDSITTDQIADNAITSAKIASNTIQNADISDAAISPAKLAGNPGNGVTGTSLISNGDGSFSWGGFVTTQNNTMILGTGNLGIGTITPTDRVEVIGTVKIVDGNQGDGKVLVSDANGVASWQELSTDPFITASENENITFTTSGTGNVKIIGNSLSLSHTTVLSTSTSSKTITLPDASEIVVVTSDGAINITASQMADNAITSAKIEDAAIQTTHITDSIISPSKLAGTPGNGVEGTPLISNGDGTVDWGGFVSKNNRHTLEAGNLGIGTNSPTEKLEVIGTVKIVDGSQGAGKVLVSDTNGVASWQSPSGGAFITAELNKNITLTTSGTGKVFINGNSLALSNTTMVSTASTEKTITLPNASGIVVVTSDGNMNLTTSQIPDNAITSATIADGTVQSSDIADAAISPAKLAGNPGNGVTGTTLISNGDGSFNWGGFVTGDESHNYTFGGYGSTPGKFSAPYGVAISSSGQICVADTLNYRVQVFTASGNYEYSFGTYGNSPGQFIYPTDIEIDANGKMYVVDGSRDDIQVFTDSGSYEYNFGEYGTGPGQFTYAPSIAIDNDDGKIYVSDMGNNRIQIFTAAGAYDYSFGSFGSATGQFSGPWGIAVNNDKIYVADSQNKRIQVFTTSGAFDYSFTTEEFNPLYIAIDKDSKIYVTDGVDNIHVFTSSGVYDYSIGSLGSELGQYNAPYDIEIDRNGNICVAEAFNNRIQFITYTKFNTVENTNVGIGTTSPTAELEVIGTMKNDSIGLVPRATAPDTPSAGMMYYDRTDNKIKIYTGVGWESLY